MPVGKRIYLKRELPDPRLVEEFSKIPAANVADVMNRNCGMHPRIRLFSKPARPITAGPAFTVKSRAGDNLTLHAALNYCSKGDVLVCANEGDDYRSLLGEIMMNHLRYTKEIAAIVFDGPIRDLDALSRMDIPVYATGSNPAGPYKEGPGEVNVPVSCGGICVNPGDIVLLDSDGVIVIPRIDAPDILEAAKKMQAVDANKTEGSKQNKVNRDWVGKLLKEKGFEIIDDFYRS